MRASSSMTERNREFARRLERATAADAELQRRDALKAVSFADAMSQALVARGVPDATATIAAETGVLAFKRGFAAWSEGGDPDAGDDLAPRTVAALEELRTAVAGLG